MRACYIGVFLVGAAPGASPGNVATSQAFPSRLYLNLVLGNVSVTLLSNQAKYVSQTPAWLYRTRVLCFPFGETGPSYNFCLKENTLIGGALALGLSNPLGKASFMGSICWVDRTASFP